MKRKAKGPPEEIYLRKDYVDGGIFVYSDKPNWAGVSFKYRLVGTVKGVKRTPIKEK